MDHVTSEGINNQSLSHSNESPQTFSCVMWVHEPHTISPLPETSQVEGPCLYLSSADCQVPAVSSVLKSRNALRCCSDSIFNSIK